MAKLFLIAACFSCLAASTFAQWLPRFDDTEFCRPTVVGNPGLICCKGVVYSDPDIKFGCCNTNICDLYTGLPVDISQLTRVGKAPKRKSQQRGVVDQAIGAPLTVVTRMEPGRLQLLQPKHHHHSHNSHHSQFTPGRYYQHQMGHQPSTGFALGEERPFIPPYSPLRFMQPSGFQRHQPGGFLWS